VKSILDARFWNGWHGLYRIEALERLRRLKDDADALAAEFTALRDRIGPPASTIEVVSSARQTLAIDSMLVHLISCMSVEAFLNHYGVARLGEAFYKRNCERCTASQKVALLLLATSGKQLDENAELLVIVHRLFSRRNAFVHPKAIAAALPLMGTVPNAASWSDHRVPFSAERSVADMNRFFELFVAVDPSAARLSLG